MNPNKKISKTTKSMLIVILTIAAIMRFWDLGNIPYTHDEMSALNRTHFDNFSDLIEYGVKVDTHPPGIQVFTYYWIQIFGSKEWVVKLPFIIMGLWSIYLAFIIFRKWSNDGNGLMIASFLATLQFTVMYSQIARPYISGMFLLLCMVYFWDQLIRNPERNYWLNMMLSILLTAACGYNHHFSLLASALIGASGFFLIPINQWPKYLVYPIGAILLYLPNLPIFLHQLERGGVGEWLGAPKPRFIIDFLTYAFDHSYLVFFTILTVITMGIFKFKANDLPKQFWLSGIWVFAVWLIGYYYSVYINPVLQFSMLLFLFPFLLNFMLGWIPQLSKTATIGLVSLILISGIYGTAVYRDHYTIFYQNRYFQMKSDVMEMANEQTEIIFITYPHFITHPFPDEFDLDSTRYHIWENLVSTISQFEDWINHSEKDYVFLGYLEQFPRELITITKEKYPYLKERKDYSGASSYLFSKNPEDDLIELTYNVDHPDTLFSFNEEFGPGYSARVDQIIYSPYDILEVEYNLLRPEIDDGAMLVTVLKTELDSVLIWHGKDIKEAYAHGDTLKIIAPIDIFALKGIPFDQLTFNAYLWNQRKQLIQPTKFEVRTLYGNRNKYSLWEDIKR